MKNQSSENRKTKINTCHTLHKDYMADIGQCGNNTALTNENTAAYI